MQATLLDRPQVEAKETRTTRLDTRVAATSTGARTGARKAKMVATNAIIASDTKQHKKKSHHKHKRRAPRSSSASSSSSDSLAKRLDNAERALWRYDGDYQQWQQRTEQQQKEEDLRMQGRATMFFAPACNNSRNKRRSSQRA